MKGKPRGCAGCGTGMIEAILATKACSAKARWTVKAVVTLCVVVLAVALPQCIHPIAGASGGMIWLPMYLPVLLGGCLLGVRFGMAAGIAAPIVSFLLTSAAGQAMPTLARLPFMAAELAMMALITGLFSGAVAKRPAMAFVAVPTAFLGGRAFFLMAVTVLSSVTALTPELVLRQIRMGIPGMLLQAVLVPVVILAVSRAAKIEARHE